MTKYLLYGYIVRKSITSDCSRHAVAAFQRSIGDMKVSLTTCGLGGPSSIDMLPTFLIMLNDTLGALAVLGGLAAHIVPYRATGVLRCC